MSVSACSPVDDRLVFMNVIRAYREKVTYCLQMTDRSGAEGPSGYQVSCCLKVTISRLAFPLWF